jgi:hypothetical protein
MNIRSPFTTCSLLTYKVNDISLYNKSFGNQTIYTWYSPSFCLGIHDIYSFIIPCNHGVVVPIMIIIKCDVWFNQISSHAFILITWHDWLCLKHKDNPIFYKDQTFSSKCIALIVKIVTCQIIKFSKCVIKWWWNPRKLN